LTTRITSNFQTQRRDWIFFQNKKVEKVSRWRRKYCFVWLILFCFVFCHISERKLLLLEIEEKSEKSIQSFFFCWEIFWDFVFVSDFLTGKKKKDIFYFGYFVVFSGGFLKK
jgi:hypothetical protein